MSRLNSEDITKIREASKIVAKTLEVMERNVRPGISTLELDEIAEEFIRSFDARPAFKGYNGFPASICASINEEIVHGIPVRERIVRESDIVSIDVGVEKKGLFSDAARTFIVGKTKKEYKNLVKRTKEALYKGIAQVKPGKKLYDISFAIQSHVESFGFSVVKQFVGHGIGRKLHEDPQIPNFGKPGTGPLLKEGMALAIEPMVNLGCWEAQILDNGWTAVTQDGKPSAHFEHTVLVTKKGHEILTN